MPWRESTVMEEHLRLIARRLEGGSMTALCREFGLSRKTGHKLFARLGRSTGLRRWRRSPRSSARSRAGAHASSASPWRAGSGAACRCRPARRSTRVARPARPGRACACRPQRLVVRRLQEPAPAKAGGEFRLGPTAGPAIPRPPPTRSRGSCSDGRGAGGYERSPRLHSASPAVPGAQPARRDSLGRRTGGSPLAKRRPLRQPRPLRPLAAFGLVASPRHRAGAHCPGQAARDTASTSACTSPSSRMPAGPPPTTRSASQARFDAFVEVFNTERPRRRRSA